MLLLSRRRRRPKERRRRLRTERTAKTKKRRRRRRREGVVFERFETTWNQLLTSGAGVIFVVEDCGAFLGALGAVAYPEINSGRLTATEMFWFDDPSHRRDGLKLYKVFEVWARERQCVEIRMVHLSDSRAASLERIYSRLGFEQAEVHYRKELT